MSCGTEVVDWVDLGEEVGEVFGTGAPFEGEFTVRYAVLDPVVAHGYHFGAAGLAGLVEDLAGGLVVVDDHGCALRVPEVEEALA